MCYSFKTSLFSYTLGIISAIIAFFTRQYVLGCLIFSYTQMQLSEMLIWHGIDINDINLNIKGTNLGKYLLATHNIAIGIGILLSIILISKRKLKITDFIPIILGIIFFIIIIIFIYLPNKYSNITYPLNKLCTKDCQNPENRLKWPFPHDWYIYSYILSISILFIWIKPIITKYLLVFIFTFTFILSYIIYQRTVGSIWCLSASLIAPLIVLINYILIKGLNNKNILT